jgi:hypothetical protein
MRDDLEKLPFAGQTSGQLDLWVPSSSDGREMAGAVLDLVRQYDAPPLLAQVVRAQLARGIFGAAEVSFYHTLAHYAAIGRAAEEA